MTRHIVRRIVALTTCVTAALAVTLTSSPANAAPPPETGSPSLATIQANFTRTAHVVDDALRGVRSAGSLEVGIGLDGTVTAKLTGGGKAPGVAPAPAIKPAGTTAYPPVGPYWDAIRWGDVNAAYLTSDDRTHWGHPFVIFYDGGDRVDTIHPIAAEVRRWNTYDFVTVWDGDAVAGDFRAYQLSNYWKAEVDSGGRKDVCNHTFMDWNNDLIVSRMIGYWDHEAFNWNCFDIAEINYYRTGSMLGLMQGLRFHIGDGSPSIMSQPPGIGDYDGVHGPLYLWPQTYDWRTKDWYN